MVYGLAPPHQRGGCLGWKTTKALTKQPKSKSAKPHPEPVSAGVTAPIHGQFFFTQQHEITVCTRAKRQQQLSSCVRPSAGFSLHLLRLGVHAGLPRVPGHLGHGEEEEGDAGEEEEDEAAAGAGEGPAVVILHPDRVLALDHAFDRLSHHLQGDEGAQAWGGK